jgi:hypothetical protein
MVLFLRLGHRGEHRLYIQYHKFYEERLTFQLRYETSFIFQITELWDTSQLIYRRCA